MDHRLEMPTEARLDEDFFRASNMDGD